jgi:hypothetical protein
VAVKLSVGTPVVLEHPGSSPRRTRNDYGQIFPGVDTLTRSGTRPS